MESLLDVSSSTTTLIWLIASLSRPTLDPICSKFLDETLTKLLSGGRAALVVKLLHNTMFGTKKTSVSIFRDEERFNSAREGLYSLLPWWMIGIRTNYWCKLMDALLDPLQNASLNKHLAYVLVDQVVTVLFPELTQQDRH